MFTTVSCFYVFANAYKDARQDLTQKCCVIRKKIDDGINISLSFRLYDFNLGECYT